MTEIGMLARSMAGHDKGRIFIITGKENEYVFLADGKQRPICRPKKKKEKHIQVIHKRYDIKSADDAAIRKMIKEYTGSRGDAGPLR